MSGLEFNDDVQNCILIGVIVALVLYILYTYSYEETEYLTSPISQNNPLHQVQTSLAQHESELSAILSKAGMSNVQESAASQKWLVKLKETAPLVPREALVAASKIFALNQGDSSAIVSKISNLVVLIQQGRRTINQVMNPQ